MAERKSRRSFLSDVLIRAAGGVLLLSGLGAGASCGTEATKYGGAKYGGPPDDEDAGPVAKYGGPDAGVDDDAGPVAKYGGPDTGV